MYKGDRSRKETLVEYGFRLPSALDNRPLSFDEYEQIAPQSIFVSATPGPYEHTHSDQIVEQVVRPTGLVDPDVEIRPAGTQVDDVLSEINERAKLGERVLITTLTKRMAEDLTDYLQEHGVRVRYLHADVETVERMEIIRDLRLGEFDVLVGINLLREGLDLPEVSLVAIFDADKEGFLRSEGSLIQTIGRAARNIRGKAILYADQMTGSMRRASMRPIGAATSRSSSTAQHSIEPRSILKAVQDVMEGARASPRSRMKGGRAQRPGGDTRHGGSYDRLTPGAGGRTHAAAREEDVPARARPRVRAGRAAARRDQRAAGAGDGVPETRRGACRSRASLSAERIPSEKEKAARAARLSRRRMCAPLRLWARLRESTVRVRRYRSPAAPRFPALEPM